MAAHSPIEWTHHTFDLWHGCVKVSPGCKHCYAEAHDGRHLLSSDEHWGKDAPRLFFGASHMHQPLRWNREAERTGTRARVFCMSMGDLFELHAIPIYAAMQANKRQQLYRLIEHTPSLDWLLLTKRPENIAPMLPRAWRTQPRPNVWLGTSVENQATATKRLPVLLKIPARVHFASYEPALGQLDLAAAIPDDSPYNLDWLIAGSESGHRARPAQMSWFRDARDQCQRLGVRFFFKQWVEGRSKVSLPMLDGRTWCELPAGSEAA